MGLPSTTHVLSTSIANNLDNIEVSLQRRSWMLQGYHALL